MADSCHYTCTAYRQLDFSRRNDEYLRSDYAQLTQNKFVSPTTAGTMDSARLGILLVMLFLPNASTTVRTLAAFIFAFLGTMVFLGLSRLLPTKEPIFYPY